MAKDVKLHVSFIVNCIKLNVLFYLFALLILRRIYGLIATARFGEIKFKIYCSHSLLFEPESVELKLQRLCQFMKINSCFIPYVLSGEPTLP